MSAKIITIENCNKIAEEHYGSTTAKDTQAGSWFVVCDFCRQKGMKHKNLNSGLQDVLEFINFEKQLSDSIYNNETKDFKPMKDNSKIKIKILHDTPTHKEGEIITIEKFRSNYPILTGISTDTELISRMKITAHAGCLGYWFEAIEKSKLTFGGEEVQITIGKYEHKGEVLIHCRSEIFLYSDIKEWVEAFKIAYKGFESIHKSCRFKEISGILNSELIPLLNIGCIKIGCINNGTMQELITILDACKELLTNNNNNDK